MSEDLLNRRLLPGSEWLYCKLYLGSSLSDKILSKELYQVVMRIINDYADRFFFIRYTDPDYHLRLRFRLKDTHSIGEVVSSIYLALSPYTTTGQIWKIQYDTYEKEIERYGIDTIQESELLFFNDSIACMNLLSYLRRKPQETRLFVAFKMIYVLMNDFGFTLSEKMSVFEQLSASFKIEFGINGSSKQLNSFYRKWSHPFEKYLGGNLSDDCFALCESIIKRKSVMDAQVIKLIKTKTTTSRQLELIKSYIHMMMNRLFISRQRVIEVIVYDFLRKYYRSEYARRFYQKK